MDANNADFDSDNDVPLIQKDDVLGIILKSTPGPGTETGFGGYLTFYIPEGTQVVGTDYVQPDGAGDYTAVAIKGPSIAPIGAGPVGGTNTPALAGLNLGPNILGVTAESVDASGDPQGTIAGVYGDTGIFYSVDPDTVWQSWVTAGGYDGNAGSPDYALTNNRGETIVPVTKWDAEQLIAYGMKSPASPLIDPNGRGNAPWGMASAVAGPESAYAWEFDRDTWMGNGNDLSGAIGFGPWRRIQYPGSQAALDQPGLDSSTLGFVGVDASSLGRLVDAGNPLPPTLDWTDSVSPKALRFSYGGLELGRSEYGRVRLKVLAGPGEPNAPFDENGCFEASSDAFGGDAGGENGGKDHLWRYYDPTVRSIGSCAMIQKVASKPVVATGEVFSFRIDAFNLGTSALTSVTITDPLPAGLQFVSATPSPDSTAPLTWNIGRMDPAAPDLFPIVRSITMYVRATGSGELFNTATLTSEETVVVSEDSVRVGSFPLLQPDKTVQPNAVPPGATVTYDLVLNNVGSGTSAFPITITENLPPGFTYAAMVDQRINGGVLPANLLAVDASNPGRPVFTVSQGIDAGEGLLLRLDVLVSPNQEVGTYANSFAFEHNGNVVSTGSLAPVSVGGGRIGDTVYRDWAADGQQDVHDEGIAGITVRLYDQSGLVELDSTVTDANGHYAFRGLLPGVYVVAAAPPAGYIQTYDADGTGTPDRSTVSLAFNESNLAQDFGYLPAGSGSIGDLVFADGNGDGVFNGADSGIDGVIVRLFEDGNGNGTMDVGDYEISTAVTDGNGNYWFTGLAEGVDYLVEVQESDPDLASRFAPDTFAATTPGLHLVTSLSGSVATADFGFKANVPLSIGDTVFLDADADGVYGAGSDRLLPNITVTLYRDSDGDGTAEGAAIAIASSDLAGQYLFSGLAPDTYLVVVDASDPQLPAGSSASIEARIVTLTTADVLTADFPFVDVLSKTVDKAFAAPGDQLTYSIHPTWPGPGLLTGAVVTDTVPDGTTMVSAGQGGSTGSFVSVPGIDGVDPGSPGSGTEFVAASMDSWLDADADTANHGTELTMLADRSGGDLGDGRPVMLFDPAGIPAGVTITGATLRLTEVGSDATVQNVDVHQLTTNWSEETVTWKSPWAAKGGDFDGALLATQAVSGNAQYGWSSPELTTLVENWYEGTTDNFGIILGIEGGGGGTKEFSTREADGGQPLLEVTYDGGTPAPATTCSIDVAPVTVGDGGTVTVTMSLSSDTELTGVSPTALTFTGAAAVATLLSGPTPASLTVPGDGSAVDFVWSYRVDLTMGSSQEFTFSGGAGNGIYNFVQAISNSAQVSEPLGTTVTWSLGSNTPALPGSDPGAIAGADSAALTAVADNEIWSLSPDSNYGGATKMWTAGLGDVDRSVVRFDLSSIPANAIITSATMRLSRTGGAGGSVAAHRVLASWAENESTWNHRASGVPWTISGGDYDPTAEAVTAMEANGPYTWELGGLVQEWIDGTPNEGVLIRQSDESVGGDNEFATREDGTAGDRPLLTVSYDLPAEPATSTSIAVSPVLVTDPGGGKNVQVSMTVSADEAVTGISPGALTVIPGSHGANATYVSGPTGSPADTGAGGGSATFTWVYSVSAGSQPDEVRFSGGATGTGATFAGATSHGVLVTPPLTMVVAVNSPDPGVAVVTNTANFSDAATLLASDTAQTALSGSIGDFVWADLDGDGFQDPGEPGLGGVEVCATNGVDTSCDTTDGSGRYRIFGLDSNGGNPWSVSLTTATLPAGYVPSSATTLGRTLGADSDSIDDADFGLRPPPPVPASIGDTVWIDANGNGVIDVGEVPLPGITVNVYADANNNGEIDGSDILLETATTDAAGNYLFDGLFPGDYLVGVDESSPVAVPQGGITTLAAAMDLVSGTNLHDVAVTLSAGGSYSDADFGYNWSGSIGDSAFYDDDGDGTQDLPGETNAVAVTVVLYEDLNGNGDFDSGEPPAGFTETDGSGTYLFDNLPPGDYVVKFDESTVESRSTPGDFGTMVPTTGEEFGVSLGAGVEFLDADAGFIEAAIVEGHVFHDLDSNGFPRAGEPGIPLVGVTLTGTDLTGAPVSLNADTDAEGEYRFFVPPGTYGVTYATGDEDIPSTLTLLTTTTLYNVSATAGAEIGGLDFGRDHSGSVGDTVFSDADGDGSQGPSEPGLAGVTVQLFASDGTTLLATVFTGPSGAYLFTGLGDGTYVVEVDGGTVPAGFDPTPTADPDFSPDGRGTAAVTSGGTDLSMDFGFQPASTTHALGGTVFADNGDGVLDAGEAGIGGVRVTAEVDADGDGDADQVFNATTAPDGSYAFSGIPDGSDVTLAVATATLPGTAYAATGDADSPAPNGDDLIAVMNVTGDVTGRDFGYEEQLGSLAGTVVHGDGDGLAEDGEPPLEGVAVTLTFAGEDGVLGTADDSQQATTTDASGNYGFTGLAPGAYEVAEMDPPGYASLADADGGNPGNISVALGSGESLIDQDFEDAPARRIAGRVAKDEDRDGDLAESASEPELNGVTIELWEDPNGDGFPSDGFRVRRTSTSGNGNYLFEDVPEGDYVVIEIDPSRMVSTNDLDGDDVNGLNQIGVELNGGDSSGNDFLDAIDPQGYFYSVSDGQVIPGGSISVTGPGGVTIELDGSEGEYAWFIDGTPGVYTLTATAPAGWEIDPATPPSASALDPTGQANPYSLGNGESGGYLTGYAGPTTWHVVFSLAAGDPNVINNNIPLVSSKPDTFAEFVAENGLGGGQDQPGDNPDGDLDDNLAEYALCTDPTTGIATGAPFCVETNPVTGELEAFFKRTAGGLTDVSYTLEARDTFVGDGDDGAGWFDVARLDDDSDSHVIITVDAAGIEEVRFVNLEDIDLPNSAGKIGDEGYVRVRMEGTGALADDASVTRIFGWQVMAHGAQCETAGDPFLKKETLSGAVDNVDAGAGTLNLATAVGDGDLAAAIDVGRHYYIEVAAGDHVGHRLELDEAATIAGDGVTLHVSTSGAEAGHNTATFASLAQLASDTIVVREHRTLEEVFPLGWFNATGAQSTADRILFVNAISGFDIYWDYNGMGDAGVPLNRWVLRGDATLADRGMVKLVRPCEGFFVHPRSGTVTLSKVGIVRENPVVCPLRTSWNFVSNPWPVDRHAAPDQSGVAPDIATTVADLGLTSAAGYTGALSRSTSDQIQTWLADEPANSGLQGYVGWFLLKGDLTAIGLGIRDHWTEIGETDLSDDNTAPVLRSGRSFFLKMQNPVPDWVIPMP